MIKKPTKILLFPLRIALAVSLLGTLGRLLHWPYADEMLLFGFGATIVFYFFRYRHKHPKELIDHVKGILVFSWAMNGIAVTLYWPYRRIIQIIYLLSVICWIYLEWEKYRERKQEGNPQAFIGFQPSYIFLMIGTGMILLGNLFKILHWMYANTLLIGGFLTIIVWLMADGLIQFFRRSPSD